MTEQEINSAQVEDPKASTSPSERNDENNDEDIIDEMAVPGELAVDISEIDQILEDDESSPGESGEQNSVVAEVTEVAEDSDMLFQQLQDALNDSHHSIRSASGSGSAAEDKHGDGGSSKVEDAADSSPFVFTGKKKFSQRIKTSLETAHAMDNLVNAPMLRLSHPPSLELPSLRDSTRSTSLGMGMKSDDNGTSEESELQHAEVMELRAKLNETQALLEEFVQERNYNGAKIAELSELLANSGTDGDYLKRKALQVGELSHEVEELRQKLQEREEQNRALAQERDATRGMLVELSRVFRLGTGSSDEDPDAANQDRLRSGEILSRDHALELTVVQLRKKIEALEEQRTQTARRLRVQQAANAELSQEKEAYLIKITALEQQLAVETLDKPEKSEVDSDSFVSTPKTEGSFSLASPPRPSPKQPKSERRMRFSFLVPRRRSKQVQQQ